MTKLGKWHSGDEQPKADGWYLRDYRSRLTPRYPDVSPFSVDKFMGGFWYVMDGMELNDAGFEALPWCRIKA